MSGASPLIGRVSGVAAWRAPTWAAAMLAAAIVVHLGVSASGLLHRRPAMETRSPARSRAAPDLGLVAGLFGRAAESATVATVPADELELTGTLSRPDPSAGFGIIRRRGESEHTYRVGAQIPGSGKLLEVYAERVVIDRGGARAVLWLPHGVLGTSLGRRVAQAPGKPQKVNAQVAASPIVPTTAEDRRAHPINLPSSPIANALHMRPLLMMNHLVGYQVSSQPGGPVIGNLPRGAVIREINGVPLTDGIITTKQLNGLAAAGSGVVVILVDDKEQTITVDATSLGTLKRPAPGRR